MNILISFLYKTRSYYYLEFIDFSLVLNTLKYLSIPLAERLAALRGLFRYFFDLDWRSSCLGYPFVREKTLKAFKVFLDPEDEDLGKKVRERFIHQSREELEAKLFSSHKKNWPVGITYENLDLIQKVRKNGKGLVLLTAHFDSSIAGSVFLGDLGFDINIFYDEVVYDKRVPNFLQGFFRKKYNAIQNHYNGGNFISKKNLIEVHRRLQRGEIFIWLHDVVLSMKGQIDVEFLSRHYKAPDSALRIALKTNSYIGAYITLWEGEGRYRTIFSEPVLPSILQNPEDALRECYTFLSGAIVRRPERWWVADTLCDYKEI